MHSAQPGNSKENLKEVQKETQKETPKEIPKETLKETPKETLKETPKETLKETPKDDQEEISNQQNDVKSIGNYTGLESSNQQNDVKSIGNYTGLESLNLRESNAANDEIDSIKKCTCTCECDLCTNVRAYHDAKRLGIDFNLTNSCYLSYLNHLSNLNHIHDLKDHHLEHFESDSFGDLIRLIPDSKILIAIATFNMNGKHCAPSLNELLMPDALEYFPDIYVIGVQEFMRDSEEVKEWTIELQVSRS